MGKNGSSQKYLLVNGIWEEYFHFVKINDNYEV